jgi:hypothetical protein
LFRHDQNFLTPSGVGRATYECRVGKWCGNIESIGVSNGHQTFAAVPVETLAFRPANEARQKEWALAPARQQPARRPRLNYGENHERAHPTNYRQRDGEEAIRHCHIDRPTMHQAADDLHQDPSEQPDRHSQPRACNHKQNNADPGPDQDRNPAPPGLERIGNCRGHLEKGYNKSRVVGLSVGGALE